MATATANKTQTYTHHAYVNSNVLDEVFYDNDSNRLFVQLLSGKVCGYADVPLTTFEALTDPKNSAGQYWNWFVKPVYKGLSGSVDLVPKVENVQADVEAEVTPLAAITVDPSSLVTTTVNPNVTYGYLVTLEVSAGSVEEALANFKNGRVTGVVQR